MKKSIIYLILFTLLLSINFTQVLADSCSTSTKKEISLLANYVKIDYEIEDNSQYKALTIGSDETTYKIPNYTFIFSIYNIVPEIYVTLEDNTLETSYDITSDMTTDGIYTFRSNDFGTIHNYVLTVNAAVDECHGSKFRTIKQTQPRYNAFSEYTYCQNSNIYYCQKFVGTDFSLSTDEFLSKISANNQNNSSSIEEQNISTIVKNNWKLYLTIFISLIVISIIVFIVIRHHNKKSGWKL